MDKKTESDGDMLDAISVIQEALIDLYLNVKVRSKDEINDYEEDDLVKERENLYMTSPVDLISYIQTSVEILMNIKVEDYLAHKKKWENKQKIKDLKRKKINNERIEEFNDWMKKRESSKKLEDSDLKCSLDGHFKSPGQELEEGQGKGEVQHGRNVDKKDQHFKTITSEKVSSRLDNDETESFIPFSQRTSMTHAPAIYEELIQKYESDIRNHIRIEQQMKLHSDSVINKLEDKEKQYDKL